MRFLAPLCSIMMATACVMAGVAPSAPAVVGHPSFLSPHSRPVTLDGEHVFVANTPADTVDVIDRRTRRVVRRIAVGVDPVGLALRPDGKELWVSNHVSDSVSVIDLEKGSATRFHVVATVQDLDPRTKATRFDEPVGIAFASNEKAYVALSSENKIAVINTRTRKVERRLNITAQDPRAIVVRGDRLYVIPFESNNKTQLSGGYEVDGDLVTFNAHEHSIANNNVLSLGHVTDIVKHPRVPDRDLYVFDTRTDRLIRTVDTLGTLLYGLTVDSKGRVFIAQTDARNDANGRSGTKKHGLAELGNRAFLNQVTMVLPRNEAKPEFLDLEPRPPKHPERSEALATPFAIQISGDDSTLVLSAAGSDLICTMDAGTGSILGRVKVGSVPRGIALEPSKDGGLAGAWVLNAVANTVSLLDLSNPRKPRVEATLTLQDPTHPAFKRGRIAFNKATASTTATFSCASCHPDGHTDQLLWVLKTPVVTGGNQIMPRSTMPVRGLRDTAPFHWDGIPGDPYGGNNSANIRSHVDPNCDEDKPESATRHVIDGSLATTMMTVGSMDVNDEGKAGLLSAKERDDMAKFLLNVTYPPAQRRAYDNKLTERAEEGFKQFHIVGNREDGRMNICGNCHRMPFLVSTNTPGSGMDAPTWRGAYDRFLILPQGRLNIIDFDFYRRVAERGNSEREIWRFSWRSRSEFDPVWEMVTEGSTGFSGSFARQLTLNRDTAKEALTTDLLEALERSAREGGIVLQCEGVVLEEGEGRSVVLQFDGVHEGGSYLTLGGKRRVVTREQLVKSAAEGTFVGTITGRHGANDDYDHPQPALWTRGSLHAQVGKQRFPSLHGDERTMLLGARHVREGAAVIVNGRRVPASLSFPGKDRLTIELKSLPEPGIHFLQVQNPGGLFSNDFIFYTGRDEQHARSIRSSVDPSRMRDELGEAIARGDMAATKRLIRAGVPANARRFGDSGMTPLSTAVFHGRMEIAKLLVENHRVSVSHHNRDGNTPLHLAAFLCREEMVEFLLRHGASLTKKNDREEAAVDTVSGAWSTGLRQFYEGIIRGSNLDLDVEEIEKQRPVMAERLRKQASGRRR